MCSIQEDEQLIPEKKTSLSADRKCMKCKNSEAVVVIRASDPLCRECFMAYCVHKFRMTFGKSRVIEDLEKLLISYSGGASSSALTHLVKEGKSERAKRPLRFLPTLVYIEEGDVVKQTEENDSTTDQIIVNMKKTGFDYATYRLNQVFCDQLTPVHTNVDELCSRLSGLSTTDQSPKVSGQADTSTSQLQQLLDSARSLTAKQQLVAKLRFKLLGRIAKLHGVRKVLLGDSGTLLATRMLSNITQGGGAHLSYEMGFIDNRRDGVKFLRPMKGFTSKEVALYNSLNQVESVFIPNLSTKAATNSSLQRLTEEFVNGLQAEFPNTVYTVCRTGEKLDLVQASDGAIAERCCMCEAPLDTNVGESSALSATIFSQQLCDKQLPLSAKPPAETNTSGQSANQHTCDRDQCASMAEATNESDRYNNEGDKQCCGEGDGSCQSLSRRVTRADVNAALCYCCRLIIKDIDDFEKLPSFLMDEVGRRNRRQQMKEEIAEFLLDGPDSEAT